MAMLDRDLQVARKLKDRLSSVVTLIDFKVFGSRARGDADEYSDLDVFIEVETLDKELKNKISDIAWEVGFYNDCIHISPLIFTRYEIEESPLRISSIVQVIAEEGVRV
ncbi:MAG: nucleotidyltransferase domain-containing protein [Steroidobacteraceae bacterium]|nr:nucleotidyltransferase domain-containing protein [Deltaproteobacteria bacterium]